MQETTCSIHPYFQVSPEVLPQFKAMCEEFKSKTSNEKKCHHYSFTCNGELVHCREHYENADGVLAHLDNVGDLLNKALTMAKLIRLEIHGPEKEIALLREPLASMKPDFFVMI